jgi:hypothetical protein
MSTVSTRPKYSTDPVRSVSTDTGRLARTPIGNPFSFFVGFAGTPLLLSVANVNLGELLHWGSFDYLALPVVGILSGLMATHWEAHAGNSRVKYIFSHEDRELLRKAKKNIGLRRRLAMLFHLSSAPTVLLVETDKYKMTHTKAELVRQRFGDGYAIEIETTSALKTWDLALESVVPETVSETVMEASVIRDTRYLIDKIREQELTRDLLMFELEEYEASTKSRLTEDHDLAEDYDYDFAGEHECSHCAL